MPTDTKAQERPTIEVKTANGHVAIIKQWITGGESRAIQSVFLEAADMRMTGEEMEVSGVKGGVAAKAQDKAFEITVVSIDGASDNIVSRILDLPSEDFAELTAAINEVTRPKKK